MNFSVTGEPAPSQLDEKRKSLLQSMLRGGPGASRLLSQPGGRQGLSRGYSASDSPTASVPGLTFNPFLAQLQRGVAGLQAPTQQSRQVVDDLTGGAPGLGMASAGLDSPDGSPPMRGFEPQQAPVDLAGAYAGAGIDPNNIGDLSWLDYGSSQTPPPPVAPPIPYLRPTAGKIAF